jgi:hypothetical protein
MEAKERPLLMSYKPAASEVQFPRKGGRGWVELGGGEE